MSGNRKTTYDAVFFNTEFYAKASPVASVEVLCIDGRNHIFS